jgi:hypothetical protein
VKMNGHYRFSHTKGFHPFESNLSEQKKGSN